MLKKSRDQFKLSKSERKAYEIIFIDFCSSLVDYHTNINSLNKLKIHREIGEFVRSCQRIYHNKDGVIKMIAKDLQTTYGRGMGYSIRDLRKYLHLASDERVFYYMMGIVQICEDKGIPFNDYMSYHEAEIKCSCVED